MNTHKIRDAVRHTLQKTGFDLVRFRSLNTVLAHQGITMVFDVGANVGQYASDLRRLGYAGKIVSFEPLKRTFEQLAAAASRDPAWTPVNLGLGSAPGESQINVYTDPCMNSMLTLDQKKYINTASQVGMETIKIETLDRVLDRYVTASDRVFLKIDTQGYEKQVLHGAEQSLPKMRGVQLELSITPIYAGQPAIDEMIALMRGKGFTLWKVMRGLVDVHTDREYEMDGIFINEGMQSS